MRSRLGAHLVSSLLLPRLVAAAHAQPQAPPGAVRAIDPARTTVVTSNAGLSLHRPARCLFTSPVPANPGLVGDDANGNRFHVVGGKPARERCHRMPTRQSEILIDPEGRLVKPMIHDGAQPPRWPAGGIGTGPARQPRGV